MKKEMNNKGFSLVELIIVVAIMAVLIGVLAPAYLQYVEKSKKTKDCQAVGSIMDACEIVASDVAVVWDANEAINIKASKGAVSYTNGSTEACTKLPDIVKEVDITGTWGGIEFEATKLSNGNVVFKWTNGGMTLAEIGQISPDLEGRFQ
jgi:prepilin-type N-terminal cleavage/methylation domain-containing protein